MVHFFDWDFGYTTQVPIKNPKLDHDFCQTNGRCNDIQPGWDTFHVLVNLIMLPSTKQSIIDLVEQQAGPEALDQLRHVFRIWGPHGAKTNQFQWLQIMKVAENPLNFLLHPTFSRFLVQTVPINANVFYNPYLTSEEITQIKHKYHI